MINKIKINYCMCMLRVSFNFALNILISYIPKTF